MSYILEALRRADAERQRGQVPGLNTQPAAAAHVAKAPALPAWGWAAAAALLLLLLLVMVLWWAWPAPPSRANDASAGPSAVAVQPLAVPSPEPAPQAPASPLPVVVSAPPRVVPAPAPAAEPAPVVAAAPVVPPPPRLLKLAELSVDQRREFPPLTVSGSIWSESAASRFVMINGQIVREGETAAPGVVLERINQRSAVLRWRELRLELPF